jgi:PilZ domain
VAEQREQHRIAVHYRLVIRHAGLQGHGTTENLSDHGAMLSVTFDPPLTPGDLVDLELELPGVGPITVGARVRWTSTVLPGMTGVEFTPPVLPELLGHIAQILHTRLDRAEGF